MWTASPDVDGLVDIALAEDIGQGDWTTLTTTTPGSIGLGRVIAKQDCVIAGLGVFVRVFERLGGGVVVRPLVEEGARVTRGTKVLDLEGPFAALLTGERVALNFLQRMSGIATLTRAFVDAVAGTRARIVDTRKTVPGLRRLDKYAVRVGGGENHRAGLDGGILIKENHIAAAGGIAEAVARARRGAPFTLRIEVETQTLADVDAAIAAGADIIMLDNMPPETMVTAVARIGGRALVEASGNVRLATVRAIAETGVDLVSVGALTHSVQAADLSMLVELRGAA